MKSLGEWKNESANVHDEKKKKKQRVNLEPPRPMAVRLISTNPRLTDLIANKFLLFRAPLFLTNGQKGRVKSKPPR